MNRILNCVIITTILFLAKDLQGLETTINSKYAKSVKFSPFDKEWDSVESVTIPLMKQVLVAPHGGSIISVDVSSIYTDDEIFIRLIWDDKTKDTKFSPIEKFVDACAIQMPVNYETLPSPIMGEKTDPVNIWLWRAISHETERIDSPAYSDFYREGAIDTVIKFNERAVENLTAEGFGTITPLDVQDVEGTGRWRDGRWSAVIKRRLDSTSGVKLGKDIIVPIAFAVWDGANSERGGAKSVSVWHFLKIGEARIEKPKDEIAKGERVYTRYGCVTCHGKEGKEPVANLNAQGGKVPALTYVAEGFTIDELKDRIRQGRMPQKENPAGPYPPLWMNAWKTVMSEDELDVLTKYLLSLMPKEESGRWTQ